MNCAKIIYGPRVTRSRCQREATHGEFCSQHAGAREAAIDAWRIERMFGYPTIECVKVAEITAKTVLTAKGQREARATQWYEWHETQDAAVSSIRTQLEQQLHNAERSAAEARDSLERLNKEFPR